MPDLDEGQRECVPIVLEPSFADVQYSAYTPRCATGQGPLASCRSVLAYKEAELQCFFFNSSQAEVSITVNPVRTRRFDLV